MDIVYAEWATGSRAANPEETDGAPQDTVSTQVYAEPSQLRPILRLALAFDYFLSLFKVEQLSKEKGDVEAALKDVLRALKAKETSPSDADSGISGRVDVSNLPDVLFNPETQPVPVFCSPYCFCLWFPVCVTGFSFSCILIVSDHR